MLFEILDLGRQKPILLFFFFQLFFHTENHFGSFLKFRFKDDYFLHIFLLSLDYVYIGFTCWVFWLTSSSTILRNYNLFFVSSRIFVSISSLSSWMIRSFSPISIFRMSICFCSLLFVIQIYLICSGKLFKSWLKFVCCS